MSHTKSKRLLCMGHTVRLHIYVSWNQFEYCRWFVLQTLNASAHPQSLRLHLEVRLHLARGEVPHCRHRVFVIRSHPGADGETTGLTEQYVEKDSVKEKGQLKNGQDGVGFKRT